MADTIEPIKLTPIARPGTNVTTVPAATKPEPKPWMEQLPMPLYWGLVAISATVLILQIWNYLA